MSICIKDQIKNMNLVIGCTVGCAYCYSPTWIDGKKHARNVYAHTREECEEKLKVLIAEMKAELAELKRQKADRH